MKFHSILSNLGPRWAGSAYQGSIKQKKNHMQPMFIINFGRDVVCSKYCFNFKMSQHSIAYTLRQAAWRTPGNIILRIFFFLVCSLVYCVLKKMIVFLKEPCLQKPIAYLIVWKGFVNCTTFLSEILGSDMYFYLWNALCCLHFKLCHHAHPKFLSNLVIKLWNIPIM